MTPRLICQSCDENKHQLEKVNSELIPGYQLTICKTCKDKGYEPRYIVILAVNQFGTSNTKVRSAIKNHRYHGLDIPASDIV